MDLTFAPRLAAYLESEGQILNSTSVAARDDVAARQTVDTLWGRGLIMRFSWDKVAEAHAGIGVLMVGLNVV